MHPNSLCLLHATGEDRPQTRKHGVKVTADGVEQANITGEVREVFTPGSGGTKASQRGCQQSLKKELLRQKQSPQRHP